MKSKVCFVEAEDIYALRFEVLRPHRPFDEIKYSDDHSPTTFHVAVMAPDLHPRYGVDSFQGKKIVTAATFVKEVPPPSLAFFLKYDLAQGIPYRLRGMATAKNVQGQGFGQVALDFAELHLHTLKVDLLWFNAREIAYPFYEKLGYEFFGDSFELPYIGPHKVMYKRMKSDSV